MGKNLMAFGAISWCSDFICVGFGGTLDAGWAWLG